MKREEPAPYLILDVIGPEWRVSANMRRRRDGMSRSKSGADFALALLARLWLWLALVSGECESTFKILCRISVSFVLVKVSWAIR